MKKPEAEPADRDDSDGVDTPGGGVAVAPPVGNVSLEGVHGSVKLPGHQAGFWRQWWAFSGPAILVSVGYMDPGNWGTDLQARRPVQVRAAVGRRHGQPDGHLHAGDLPPAWA